MSIKKSSWLQNRILPVSRFPQPIDNLLIYHTTISGVRTCWEASITLVTATRVLKANDGLEFGERAKWSPESIVGAGVIKDLYSLADEIVRVLQMLASTIAALSSTSNWNGIKFSNSFSRQQRNL